MKFSILVALICLTRASGCGAQCDTVPIRIYSATRAAPLPSVNALAAIMVYFTVTALGLTYLVYRFMTRHERPKGGGAAASMMGDIGGM